MTSQDDVFAAGQQSPGSDTAGEPRTSLTEWRIPTAPERDATAAAPSPKPADLDVEPEVFVEQVRLLYQHPSLIAVNVLNALLVVAVLWRSFPHRPLVLWFGLFLIVIPVRLLIAHLQGRQRWPAARTATWSVIGSAVTGGAWGLLAFAIISASDIAYQVFIVFVLGGMTAGAVLLDAAYLPAFFAFVLPIILPPTLAFMLRGDLMSIAMGGMLAIFAAVQAVIGYRTNRWIVDTLRLQAQRENLTADLYRTTAELTRREAILRIMANHDELTGLFNRYYLFETMGREMRRAQRLHAPITIAILDIDHFKDFNDNFGHEAGDEVLRAIGALLQRSVRGSDIVCRYGGEEFLLVFFDSDTLAALPRLAQICESIKDAPYACRGLPLPSVTLSVGVAQYPIHARTVDSLIRAADRALYAAKKAGRDRIEVVSQ
jgi:diguanylate cyclase (GGDEF)-like protein